MPFSVVRAVRRGGLAVGQDVSAIGKCDDAVAEQGPALIKVMSNCDGRVVVRSIGGGAGGGMVAHGNVLSLPGLARERWELARYEPVLVHDANGW